MTTAIVVPKEAPRRFSDPASSHSIGDRKHLTEDALKLSEHELKKVLKQRIDDAEKACRAKLESMDPLFCRYNDALDELVKDLLPPLRSDIEFSFNCIGRMRIPGNDDDSQMVVKVEVCNHIAYFWCSREEKKVSDPYQRSRMSSHYLGAVARLGKICDLVAEGDSASDVEIPISIDVTEYEIEDGRLTDDEREGGFYCQRVFDATCSEELMNAREAIAREGAEYFALKTQHNEAKKELERLPEMMKELEMQATAERLKGSGGEHLLRSVLSGVSRIIKGEQISGLHLAVPEAQTIMGAPEEHGPESASTPEVPAADVTQDADAAPSEETVAPAEEAAAESSSVEDAPPADEQE